jgi:hypothetical protein
MACYRDNFTCLSFIATPKCVYTTSGTEKKSCFVAVWVLSKHTGKCSDCCTVKYCIYIYNILQMCEWPRIGKFGISQRRIYSSSPIRTPQVSMHYVITVRKKTLSCCCEKVCLIDEFVNSWFHVVWGWMLFFWMVESIYINKLSSSSFFYISFEIHKKQITLCYNSVYDTSYSKHFLMWGL